MSFSSKTFCSKFVPFPSLVDDFEPLNYDSFLKTSTIDIYHSTSYPDSVLDSDDMEIYDHSRRSLLQISELFTLTIGLLGMQFTWSVELAYGTPFLLSLGLEKSRVSLVWLAGPISGLLIQPVVGAFSDRCTSRIGRRRPFVIGGSVMVLLSMLAIAFARELGGSSPDIPGVDDHLRPQGTSLSIFIAICSFYVLDFSVNVVQAALRALILDIPPTEQQQSANAWATVMLNFGNIFGYAAGVVDLGALFHVKGKAAQMKLLCLVGSVVFVITIAVTCVFTREKPIIRAVRRRVSDERERWYHTFVELIHAVKILPHPIRQICQCQFFVWLGYFAFLFYSSTWVAEYVAQSHKPFEGPFSNAAERAGSFALLLFSVVSFISAAFLPLLTQRSDPGEPRRWYQFTIPQVYTASNFLFFFVMWSSLFVYTAKGATMVIATTGVLWAVTIWAPLTMIGEYLSVQEDEMAPNMKIGYERLVDEGNCGPSEMDVAVQPEFIKDIKDDICDSKFQEREVHLTDEVNNADSVSESDSMVVVLSNPANQSSSTSLSSKNPVSESPVLTTQNNDTQIYPSYTPSSTIADSRSRSPCSPHHQYSSCLDTAPESQDPRQRLSAGTILGIHNVYVVLPQFVCSLLSAIMFSVLNDDQIHLDPPIQPGRTDDSIGWILRIGGLSSIIAGVLSSIYLK